MDEVIEERCGRSRFFLVKIAVLWDMVLINHELPGVILKPIQNWHEWMLLF
jgi:hypothetical protein